MPDATTTAPAAPAPASPGLVPELLDAAEAAALCGMSLRAWREADDGGLVPGAAYRHSRLIRWGRRELVAWMLAGCPNRGTWQQARESTIRRFGEACR